MKFEDLFRVLVMGMWRIAVKARGTTVSFTVRSVIEHAGVDECELGKRGKWMLGILLSEFAENAGCSRVKTGRGLRVICRRHKLPISSFEEFKKYVYAMITREVP